MQSGSSSASASWLSKVYGMASRKKSIGYGVSIIVGAPFASGILASGPIPGATYGYSTASEDVQERVRKLMLVCERHSVPLGAAAL
jgi:D-threo-aldose 1-dehydrogenase